ncbi:restriction endonuclease subunit S [Streptomyces sp. DG2A-72]|uniref:restriction endonuclease subunit S n=1 Tax=Streptomyces sp. DG2A-72 TaxID=3051386 RepID=UPI00265C2C5A|nr:restriction endonuclease subunit S [Streptomyces sp. DG2A-72]MDO0933341.1 restriction endonuclease subunit S [Streptomyces sp. DG2A-72]
MRELAPGWTLSKVGDLFDMQIGKKLNKEASAGLEQREYVTNKDVQWNRIHFKKLNRMSFSAAERERFRLLPGDLLVTEGGEVGRTAIWEGQREECYFQMSLHRLRTRGAIEPRYMLHYMAYAARFDLFVNGVSQTSIAHLPQDKFAEQLIAHPVDLAEQRRIVEVIDGVSEMERGIEASIAKLRSVRRGALLSAMESVTSESPLPGWARVPLKEVVPSAEYGISEALDRDACGMPVLRMNNIQDGRIDAEELRYCPVPVPEKLFLRRGDVLFNRTNSMEHIGKSAIWRDELPNATFASYLVRLIPDLQRVTPEYLVEWLMHPLVRQRVRSISTVAVQQVNVNPSRLRELAIDLPVDLAEQRRIVATLEACDEQMDREVGELNKLRQLKQGLVDDLLSGRAAVSAVA